MFIRLFYTYVGMHNKTPKDVEWFVSHGFTKKCTIPIIGPTQKSDHFTSVPSVVRLKEFHCT